MSKIFTRVDETVDAAQAVVRASERFLDDPALEAGMERTIRQLRQVLKEAKQDFSRALFGPELDSTEVTVTMTCTEFVGVLEALHRCEDTQTAQGAYRKVFEALTAVGAIGFE